MGLLLVSDANLLPRAPSRRPRGRPNDNARPEFGIAAIAVLPRCLPAALWGHLDRQHMADATNRSAPIGSHAQASPLPRRWSAGGDAYGAGSVPATTSAN